TDTSLLIKCKNCQLTDRLKVGVSDKITVNFAIKKV
ncbi:MAG: hypothetical protein ACI9J5_000828, partial [Paraglaciecola sp.]